MSTDKKTNKIACEIIQDLMPTYIDGLASESTVRMIEEHIAGCDDCRKMLESMKSDDEMSAAPDEREVKEIDFLKKSRNKNRRAVILGILLTILLAAAAVGAKQYIIGSEYRGDMSCDIEVDGSNMQLGVTAADSMHVIRGVDFTVENGVASGKARAVLPGIFNSGGTIDGDDIVTCDWAGSFSFDEEIREVRIGDRIYWADGRNISPRVSAVYNAGHEYIGDAPANSASLEALGIVLDFGSLYSELQTDKEPYGWAIILDGDQAKYNPDYLGKRLEGYGYVLLGTVSNLDEVEFRYTADGKTISKKITCADASRFLGRDIKECRSDAGALAELMEKADLD